MSITVKDCLDTKALKAAKVVAGEKGLDKIVTSVSVIEYADYDALTDDYFLGNELLISAFTSIKDDVDAQCRIIRRLHEVGEVGLVLYYVGVFVKGIDKRLIDTADELGFPLICMPEGVLGLRYSEALGEIFSLINKEEPKEKGFVSDVMKIVAQFPERQRSLQSVLRIISDKLRLTVALSDYSLTKCIISSWPMWIEWNKEDILSMVRNNEVLTKIISHKQYPDIFVSFIGEDKLPTLDEQELVAEAIGMVMSTWHLGFYEEDRNDLIRAILNDDPIKMRQISERIHFDIKSIHTMWIIVMKDGDKNDLVRLEAITRMYLKRNDKNMLVDSFDDTVVAFMDDAPFKELDANLTEEFMDEISNLGNDFKIIVHNLLINTTDVRNAYTQTMEHWKTAAKVYPEKNILTQRMIQFGKECEEDVMRGEEHLESILKPIEILGEGEEGDDLIKTIKVFLLDADSNTKTTGDHLFVHKNTVNYRMNKIKKILGFDATKMPEAYALYKAVAIHRILFDND